MHRHVTVLVIEDNPGDVFLIKRCFSKTGVPHTLAVANDGEEALDYLYMSLKDMQGYTRPDLILLDLNLPKIDGKEILYRIKQHETLKNIPVVMFSSSSAYSDIQTSYDLHANCYVVKPYDLDEFSTAIENIFNFWTSTAILPASNG